jgi:hypothetical protein
MTEKRVNPKTGIVEERSTGFFGGSWAPAKNERGNTERVNAKTGVTEERWTAGGGALYGWGPKSNERGNQERINKDTGVKEERWSLLGGAVTGWDAKRDGQGNRERINQGTGVKEQSWRAGGSLVTGWEAKRNENDRIERVRRDGRTEERHEMLGGLVNVWDFKRDDAAGGVSGGRAGDPESPDYADTRPSAAPNEELAEASAGGHASSSSRSRFRLPDVGFAPWLFGYCCRRLKFDPLVRPVPTEN